MFFLILTTLIVIAIFVVTVFNLVKKNNTNYLYLLIIEFIGILIDFIHIFIGKDVSPLGYGVIYLVSVIIPIMVLIVASQGFCFEEILGLLKIKMHPESEKDILLELATKYKDHYQIHKRLAEYYEKNGELENAEDEYYIVIRIKEDDYKSYCKLGKILECNKKSDEAIKLMEGLLKMNPECTEGSLILGEIYYENDMFKEALVVYNEALKFAPGEYDLYYALGMTYTRLNDFKNAEDYYRKAAQLNSIKDVASLNIGQINMIFKEYDEAEKYFFETLDSDDEKIVACSYYYLAKIKMIKGEEAQAIQYANLAIELYPKIIRKIEVDENLISVIGKLKIVKDKEVKSQITKKEEEIIEYLENINGVVENLTDRFSPFGKVDKEHER